MIMLVLIHKCPPRLGLVPPTDLQDDAAVGVRERFRELSAAHVGGGAETAVRVSRVTLGLGLGLGLGSGFRV